MNMWRIQPSTSGTHTSANRFEYHGYHHHPPTSKGQLRRAFCPDRSPGTGPILPAKGQKRSGRNSSSLSMSARSHLHVRMSNAVTTLCLQSAQNLQALPVFFPSQRVQQYTPRVRAKNQQLLVDAVFFFNYNIHRSRTYSVWVARPSTRSCYMRGVYAVKPQSRITSAVVYLPGQTWGDTSFKKSTLEGKETQNLSLVSKPPTHPRYGYEQYFERSPVRKTKAPFRQSKRR